MPFHLLTSKILDLQRSGDLAALPNIPTASLNNKSKDNIFIKLIAIFRVSWFVLQVTVRAAKGLNISQLEIAVTAFAVCAIITYLLILPKPKGLQIPIERLNYFHSRILQGYVRGLFAPVKASSLPSTSWVRRSQTTPYSPVEYLHFGVAIGGVIFGAIHIADFDFPTPIERTLRHIASVLSTALLPVMY